MGYDKTLLDFYQFWYNFKINDEQTGENIKGRFNERKREIVSYLFIYNI